MSSSCGRIHTRKSSPSMLASPALVPLDIPGGNHPFQRVEWQLLPCLQDDIKQQFVYNKEMGLIIEMEGVEYHNQLTKLHLDCHGVVTLSFNIY